MKRFNKTIGLSIIGVILANPLNALAMEKTETIYSTLKYNGDVKKTVINTKLADITKGDVVDYTDLNSIKNLNGREKFKLDNKRLTWKSNGKDIFYQGKIDEELPIGVDVKYYLDDKEVKPSDITGKSGKIKIVYNFTNNSYNTDTGMYTPFVVSTTSIIKGSNNSHVSISTGKVINNGKNNIVTGISAPGLYKSTGISDFSNLDSLTISYDTTKFSTNEVYFVITPKLLSEVDLSSLDKVNSLSSSLELLQSSMNEAEDGANKLNNGARSAADGVSSLNSGARELNNGIKSAMDGARSLADGTGKVDSNLAQIIAGLESSKNELALKQSGATSQLASINDLITTNNNTINKLTAGNNQIAAGVSAKGLNITDESFTATITSLHNAGGIDDATYNSLVSYKSTYDTNAGLIELITGNNTALSTMKNTLVNTSSEITNSLNSLDGYLNQLKSQGTAMTNAGANSLYQGLVKIYNGSNSLVSGTGELSSGINELYSGTGSLASGISQVNSQGINKITDYGNKAKGYTDKFKILTNLSKNYHGFGSNNSDTTIFIYKISK